MFTFERDQLIYPLGGVNVGGQPGELATVLVGSIFYEGHKIVKDSRAGVFNKKQAEGLITRQEELSDKTGNPHMVDVVGLSSNAIRKYIDFVAAVTDAPILVDSSQLDVRIAGVRYAKEIGLADRTVYNSIAHHVDQNEINALKEVGIKSAILLAYNPQNVWPTGRIELLCGTSAQRGLLALSKEAGIERFLVDTAVLDVPSIGLAAEAITLVKKELGLPCGGAPVNAVSEWRTVKTFGADAKNVCMANAVTAMQYAGANFLLYGPIQNAEVIFPAAAMADALIAYTARLHGIKMRVRNHPLLKIF